MAFYNLTVLQEHKLIHILQSNQQALEEQVCCICRYQISQNT